MALKLGRKKESSPEVPKRIRNLTTPELRLWMSNSVMNLGASVDGYLYSDLPEGEVDTVLESINFMWEELKSRP